MPTKNDTNIQTLPTAGTQGWNLVYEDNTDELTEKLNGPLHTSTNNPMGDTTVADAAAATVASPTITTIAGTGNDADINTNFTELKTQIDALIADNVSLRTQLNAFLAASRKTTGCGVLDG
jgi:hypothetical protein